MYSYEDVKKSSLAYFEGDERKADIFINKYALRDNDGNYLEKDPNDMHDRLAREFARIETKKFENPYSYDEIRALFHRFKYLIPQGSPSYAIGNHYKYVSSSNCFVTSTIDSYGGILKTDEHLAQISKRRGGVGVDVSPLRPKNSPTKNSSQTSTGIIPFCERFSNTIREVGQAARRGALMLTVDVHHPEAIIVDEAAWENPQPITIVGDPAKFEKDIHTFSNFYNPNNLDFATMKMNRRNVTGANVSIRVSDSFLEAVKNGTTFEQRFPVNYKELGIKPLISRQVDARKAWKKLIHSAWQSAEPGILFWDRFIEESPADCYAEYGFKTISTNPCQPAWAPLLTKNGIRQLKNINIGDEIWSENGWVKVTNKWSTGIKKVYRYRTTSGTFYGTKDHRVVSHGTKIAAQDASSIDNLVGSYIKTSIIDPQDIMDGLVIGDGSVHKASNNLIHLYIGDNDQDYFNSEIAHLILEYRPGISDKCYEIKTTIQHDEIDLTYNRSIPERFIYGNRNKVCGFLRGLFSANGSICGDRIALKTSSIKICEQVQLMLSSIGISSYFTSNKPSLINWSNGQYLSKESYDINITTDREKFIDSIGFIQIYKTEKLEQIISKIQRHNRIKETFDIIYNDLVSEEEVFDITVDGPSHTYWTGGCNVSNCAELGLSALDSCRLLVINLCAYVKNAYINPIFDWKLFYQHAYIAQRLMDDLIDLEIELIDRIIQKIKDDPEEDSIKQNELELWNNIRLACSNGRRTGLGITGLGDTIAMMNQKYDESHEFVERIYKTIKFASYECSADMAKELGPFSCWSWDLEKDNKFIMRFENEFVDRTTYCENSEVFNSVKPVFGNEILAKIKRYGRRNIANLTTAPVGTISQLALLGELNGKFYHETTSGIEPLYDDEPYIRRRKVNHDDAEVKVDFIDGNGDKWQNYNVYPTNIKYWMEITNNSDYRQSPYHNATANKINWKNRVRIQASAQKHVDHSISSCLASGESTVFTDKGLFDISELVDSNLNVDCFGELPFSSISSVNINNKNARITSSYNNGIAKTRKIKMDTGRYIQCTDLHKIVVLNNKYELEWRRADSIEVGDWIVGRMGLNLWNNSSTHISHLVGKSFDYTKLTNSKSVRKIQRISCDLARLIGYLMSDGSVGCNGINLTQVDNNIGPHFISLVDNLFGVSTSIQKDNRAENLYQYVVNSREISSFFKYLGLTDHDSQRVPLVIRRSGKECVKEFIRGATLDGYVAKNGIGVATSTSYKYLEDISNLLLNLGISARIHKCNHSGERQFPSGKSYITKDAYVLFISHQDEIEKFANMIGFAEDRKQIEMSEKYKRPSRIKPGGNIPDFGLRKNFREAILSQIKSRKFYDYFHSMCCKSKYGMKICRESLLEMTDYGFKVPEILLDNTYTFSQVKSIEDGGYVQTYDLSVPDSNSYIVNGFISHNTINLPSHVSEDEVADIYLEAWKAGCKGLTVYRDGCRSGVLVKKTEKMSAINNHAPKRPKDLLCDIYCVNIKGNQYVVTIGLYDNNPYEVMVACGNHEEIKSYHNGILRKKNRGYYQLLDKNENIIIDNVTENCNPGEDALSRMTSVSLRHGVDLKFILEQLSKSKDSINSFAKAIARCLKKYVEDEIVTGAVCPNCNGTLKFTEGCQQCTTCTWSKC